MDMKKTLISLLTAGLFGVMSQGAFAAPELMDKVLAVVNKDVVLASQQEALVQKVKTSAQESGQSLPDDVTLRKQALDRLIQDGRIHPARIEEMYQKASDLVQQRVREAGEQAFSEMDAVGGSQLQGRGFNVFKG